MAQPATAPSGSIAVHTPMMDVIKRVDIQNALHEWINGALDLGIRIVLAIIIFYIGRWGIKKLLQILSKTLLKKNLGSGVNNFLKSVVHVALVIVLIVVIINILGFKAVSFAALLASAGVTIGMALSGQLQNFAGGAILLFTHPFKIGDYIQAKDVEGNVENIGIFHTTIITVDNKKIYIPNGSLTTDVVINYSEQALRRCSWSFSVEYNEDINKVRTLLKGLLENEPRVFKEPEPIIVLNQLAESSVVIMVRAWVKNEEYWGLYWDFNEKAYDTLRRGGIEFPYPHLVVSHKKEQ